jgi:signal transduction histidine kinase
MQLADELMEHSQLGAGKVRLNMKPTRGLEAVRRAIDTCIASDEWHGPIPVLSSQAPEDASVAADAVRFQQIVCNLLRTAGKFTPKDGEICVEAGVDLFNFVVRVRDTGVGISAEKLPHIFDEFEQGDHAAGRYGGMGLGLSIAQGLAKLHNGRIKASSEGTGKGAEFVLEIPLLGTDGSSGPAV